MNYSSTAHDIGAGLQRQATSNGKRTGHEDLTTLVYRRATTRTRDLSVTIGDNDCVLVHCFAGCATEAVLDALGLTMRDLLASGLRPCWSLRVARYWRFEKDAAALETLAPPTGHAWPRASSGRTR